MTSSTTIVVVPRERFSATRESLESIYAHTEIPFKLVYVDGGSPRAVESYLQQQAREKGFHLIRTGYYLPPNRARNLGLSHVDSKYVLFLDNDVIVTPRWLSELVHCAEETGATIVSPLICQGTPVHEVVHCAGGESGVALRNDNGQPRRHIVEIIYRQGEKLSSVREQLRRLPTGLAEFHCMLVRAEIFTRVGVLDEALLNTKEHVDFCMTVSQSGGSIYLEPRSVVTYLFAKSLRWNELSFYALRWSDAWELASLYRLRDKWGLTEDDYFLHKYKFLGWRRQMVITHRLSRVIAFGHQVRLIQRVVARIEKVLNRYLSNRYARKHLHGVSRVGLFAK
jgi:GT2 family glycosyltransferase